MAIDSKPTRIFIGSSSEGREIAEHIQVAIDSPGEFAPTVWHQGVFDVGRTPLQSLVAAKQDYEFAILLLTPDDTLKHRDQVSSVPRDNLIFELGFFISAFGPERTIAVQCEVDNVKIPTDLLGITTARYPAPVDNNIQAAVAHAVIEIRKALRQYRLQAPSILPPPAAQSPLLPSISALVRDATDVLHQVVLNRAGIARKVVDDEDFARWRRTILNMLRKHFHSRQDDVYAIWLRPNDKQRLRVYAEDNLSGPQSHYNFGLGEGLAGSVWQTGTPAIHTEKVPHPTWLTRPDCDNATYLCAPVGVPGGKGGVLSLGSDRGFLADQEHDLPTVELFANLLAIAIE